MPLENQLFTDLSMATMAGGAYGFIENAAIAVVAGKLAWIGPQTAVPSAFSALKNTALAGRLVTPGLIDCHTHIVHGGDRAQEFEQRLNGASYEEIARAGGGIISTVKATRAASLETLVALALPRLDALISEGVCAVEIKSGYGLDMETELNMLRAARRLASLRPIKIVTSFLGAHAVPPEYTTRADAYIRPISQ